MPSYTIYPTGTNDGIAGTYDGMSDFDSARNAASAQEIDTVGAELRVVSFYDGASYGSYVSNLGFDTSSLAGSVASASITLVRPIGNSENTIRAYLNSWANAGSWTTGAALSGATLVGFVTLLGTSIETIPVTNLATITPSANLKMTLCDERHVTGTAPTFSETCRFYSADASGTTNDPYLSITTVTGGAFLYRRPAIRPLLVR